MKRKNSDKRRNSIWLLILMIVFTGVMLSTSTYAWFTVNRLVQVDSLNVKIEAQGGIDISVDGTNWKSQVTGEEIQNAGDNYSTHTNQLPEKMEPVSTGVYVSDG